MSLIEGFEGGITDLCIEQMLDGKIVVGDSSPFIRCIGRRPPLLVQCMRSFAARAGTRWWNRGQHRHQAGYYLRITTNGPRLTDMNLQHARRMS